MGTQTSSASAEWIEGHLEPPESGRLAALGLGGPTALGWWCFGGSRASGSPVEAPLLARTHRDGLRCRQSYWVVIRETKLVVEQQQASSCRFADMLRLGWFEIRQRIPETTVSHWEPRRQLQPRLSFNCHRARAHPLLLRPFRFYYCDAPCPREPNRPDALRAPCPELRGLLWAAATSASRIRPHTRLSYPRHSCRQMGLEK